MSDLEEDILSVALRTGKLVIDYTGARAIYFDEDTMMLDPETYATKTNTEHAHQTALFMWAAFPAQQLDYPQLKLMFAIPNGGLRDKITASKLKAEGVKPGVPDIMLPFPWAGYHGMFIEMKKPVKGKVSEAQEPWLMELSAKGYRVAVCYTWAEARDALIRYLTL